MLPILGATIITKVLIAAVSTATAIGTVKAIRNIHNDRNEYEMQNNAESERKAVERIKKAVDTESERKAVDTESERKAVERIKKAVDTESERKAVERIKKAVDTEVELLNAKKLDYRVKEVFIEISEQSIRIKFEMLKNNSSKYEELVDELKDISAFCTEVIGTIIGTEKMSPRYIGQTGVKKDTVDRIEEYIDKDYISADKFNDYTTARMLANELQMRIIVLGIYNAGKSTILNCLTGSTQEGKERFKTASIRETDTEQVYEQDGYLFVDTPGLDAKESDTKIATDVLKKSDIILFVHSMMRGELHEPEVKYLEQVKDKEIGKDFLARIVVVLTYLEDKEEDSEEIKEAIQRQFVNIFGYKVDIVCVSSPRYIKGMNENKTLLIKKSNYAALNKLIKEKENRVAKVKKERNMKKAQETLEEIREKLEHRREELEKQLVKENEVYTKNRREFKELVKKSQSRIDQMIREWEFI